MMIYDIGTEFYHSIPVQFSGKRYDDIWYDGIWYDALWHDMIQYGMVLYGMKWLCWYDVDEFWNVPDCPCNSCFSHHIMLLRSTPLFFVAWLSGCADLTEGMRWWHEGFKNALWWFVCMPWMILVIVWVDYNHFFILLWCI